MDLHIQTDAEQFASRWSRAKPLFQSEMRNTMNQSVLLVEGTGKALSPVKTGTLRRSITHQVGGAGGTVTGTVGTNVPYAKYVHEGTGPHVIVPVSAKALFWPGARHPVRRVNHPGTKANPFLRNALAQRRGQVLALWKALPSKVLARLGAG